MLTHKHFVNILAVTRFRIVICEEMCVTGGWEKNKVHSWRERGEEEEKKSGG